MLADIKKHDTCTLSHTHSHTLNQSFEHQGMRQEEAEKNFQRASERFGGFYVVFFRLLSDFQQLRKHNPVFLVFLVFQSYTDS